MKGQRDKDETKRACFVLAALEVALGFFKYNSQESAGYMGVLFALACTSGALLASFFNDAWKAPLTSLAPRICLLSLPLASYRSLHRLERFLSRKDSR